MSRYAIDTSPAVGAVLIDISAEDHDFSDQPLRGISIGTAGDLHITLVDGTDIVIPANALAVGIQHAMSIKIVHDDSTADEMVGWY